jgi:3D (Asp-Asp-Asp) domain-containing protein
MQREITVKDTVVYLLLSLIIAFCVTITIKVYAMEEAVTEITSTTETTVQETTTEEETTDIPLTTVKYEDIPEYTELGTFKLTAYCSCSKCCGKSDGITASGKKAKANHTVATDKSIPFGTNLMINGETYVVEDRGGAVEGNVIDIYFDSHEEAVNFGSKYAKVFEVY